MSAKRVLLDPFAQLRLLPSALLDHPVRLFRAGLVLADAGLLGPGPSSRAFEARQASHVGVGLGFCAAGNAAAGAIPFELMAMH